MPNIIWDWNGTLLDDMDVCIHSMNVVLNKYNIKPLENRNDYKSKFAFPIENYYSNLGFDFKKVPFDILAGEFISIYQPASKKCSLISNAEDVIETIAGKGLSQIVLSASKQDYLKQQVSRFNVSKYFKEMLGINNILARSKIEIGKKWIEENRIDTNELIVIGDTFHDYEVAKAFDCKCIIYTNGHQLIEERLFGDATLIDDLMEIKSFI